MEQMVNISWAEESSSMENWPPYILKCILLFVIVEKNIFSLLHNKFTSEEASIILLMVSFIMYLGT